jgi:uncharacterized protein
VVIAHAMAICMIGLLAGIAIGCVGVGGVIVVPALIYFGLMPVHMAIAAAMSGYILAGLVGTLVYARRGSVEFGRAGILCAAAVPFSVAGAIAASKSASGPLALAISALMIVSALQSMLFVPKKDDCRKLSVPQDVTIGAATGFLSSLTGTGGPAVLIPILLLFDVPIISIIGLGQIIQMPISISATVGNFIAGQFTLYPSLILGAGLAAGTLCGAHLAHSLDRRVLRKAVLFLQMIVGISLIVKTLH